MTGRCAQGSGHQRGVLIDQAGELAQLYSKYARCRAACGGAEGTKLGKPPVA